MDAGAVEAEEDAVRDARPGRREAVALDASIVSGQGVDERELVR